MVNVSASCALNSTDRVSSRVGRDKDQDGNSNQFLLDVFHKEDMESNFR